MKAIITFTSGLESSASEKTMSLSVRLGHDGDKGGTPVLEPGTTTTLDAGSNATAEIVLNGVDTEGNPKYKVNFGIPKGAKGDMPTPVQAVSSSTTDVPSCKAVTDAKELLFRDMWNSACGANGTYNATTGYYELNGITDLTYSQAIDIMNYGPIIWRYEGNIAVGQNISTVLSAKIRTLLCSLDDTAYMSQAVKLFYSFMNLKSVEIIKLRYEDGAIRFPQMSVAFYGCFKLKKIVGAMDVSAVTSFYNCFGYANTLAEVRLQGIKANISFNDSPLLSYDSVKYMIDNAANTTAIVITVHATTLSYLNGTASDYTSTGHTKEEWQAIVTSATSKNITFATA